MTFFDLPRELIGLLEDNSMSYVLQRKIHEKWDNASVISKKELLDKLYAERDPSKRLQIVLNNLDVQH